MNELLEKSGVKIKNYHGLQSRYNNNVIYLNEYDIHNSMVIAHEFGHYLLDLDREDIKERYDEVKKLAQENFTTNFISNDKIDSFKRTLNKVFSLEFSKQKEMTEKEFDEMMISSENTNNYDKLYLLVQKAVLNYNHIREEYNKEQLEKVALDIMNSFSKEQLLEFLKQNALDLEVYGKTNVELSKNKETKGLLMLSDLLSSIYDGEYYGAELPFHHDVNYYKKNPNYSFEEAFANFTSLKLNHCEKELELVRFVLGNEYYNFLDNYFNMKIQKIETKQR